MTVTATERRRAEQQAAETTRIQSIGTRAIARAIGRVRGQYRRALRHGTVMPGYITRLLLDELPTLVDAMLVSYMYGRRQAVESVPPAELSLASDAEGRWITVNGNKILIKEGQSVEDAVKERFGGEKEDLPPSAKDGGIERNFQHLVAGESLSKIKPSISDKEYSEHMNRFMDQFDFKDDNSRDLHTSISVLTGKGYTEINSFLRQGSIGEISKSRLETHVKNIGSLIDKAPPTEKELVVYRGAKANHLMEELPNLKVGDSIELNGFVSTSLKAGETKRFGSKQVIQIVVPQKSKGVLIGANTKEREVIFNHKSKFKILNLKEDVSGKSFLQLEYISPDSMSLSAGTQKAVFHLRKLFNISLDELELHKQKFGSQLREILFATGTNADTKIQEAMLESLMHGEHIGPAMKRLDEAFDAAGVTPKNSYKIESIFRTQCQMAYSGAKWQAGQKGLLGDMLWGYKYVTVGDDRVRDNHAALDGVTLPRDDPRWQTLFPPNGYMCRCQCIELFEERPIVEPPADAEPDRGFKFNPGQIA